MEILQVDNPTELESLFRLRYEVYITEMGKDFLLPAKQATDLEMLMDERDYEAIQLGCKEGGQWVATLRCQLHDDFDYLAKRFGLTPEQAEYTYAIVDRFAVLEKYRKSEVPIQMCRTIYEEGLRKGVQICLIESDATYRSLYEWLGFRMYREVERAGQIRYQLYLKIWSREIIRPTPLWPVYSAFTGEDWQLAAEGA